MLAEMWMCKAGTDVARKVVILARECNLKVELQDVEVQSLVPEPLRETPSAEAFLEGLPQASLHHTLYCLSRSSALTSFASVSSQSTTPIPVLLGGNVASIG